MLQYVCLPIQIKAFFCVRFMTFLNFFIINHIIWKTKVNVNIKLLNLCESLIVYILLSTSHWVHMALAINRPDISSWCNKIYHLNRVSWVNPLQIAISTYYTGACIGIQWWWVIFMKLFLSNIIDHGESDV